MNKFTQLNIENDIIKAIERKDYEEMTEVQEAVIPLALAKQDVIAQAPTGTGKTAAFAIPILQNIEPKLDKIQALILAPTRELAMQITNEIKEISYYQKEVNAVCVYGGEYIEKQISALRRHPQIVVATPGRLMDHMRRGTIKLDNISIIVLDEADEMLNMGFREDIDEILEQVTNEHQTMLFSATISKGIEEIGKAYLKTPEIVRVNRNEFNVPSITQKYIEVKEKDKIEIISRIIDINDYQLVMVFCNTKRMVDEVSSSLLTRGYIVEALHGDMKQMQRDRVMNRFRTGNVDILVASDVAARGLDIDDVEVVFNYDVPMDEEYYIHRIGRTGRAKREGLAVMLITRQDKYRLRQIMAYTKSEINSMEIPSLEKVMTVRIERIVKQALEIKSLKYQDTIKKSLEAIEYDPTNLITGLIMQQMNTNNDTEIKEEKPRNAKSTRIFLGLGRKDELKVSQLTDLIMNRTSLTNADINNIDMHENFTFLEIPTDKLDELTFAFAKGLNGRTVIVEEAKAKPRGKSSSRGDERNRVNRPRRSRDSRNSDYRSFKEKSDRPDFKKEYHNSEDKPRRDRSEQKDDFSEPRKERRERRSDFSEPRKERGSRSDASEPRRERGSRSDASEPRRERGRRSDASEPRRERGRRSDASEPRKERGSRSDFGEPRKERRERRSDTSEPRKDRERNHDKRGITKDYKKERNIKNR